MAAGLAEEGLGRRLEDVLATYHGTIDQVVEDIEATRWAGAHEVILGLDRAVGVDEVLDACARIAEGVGPDAVGPSRRASSPWSTPR